MHMLTKIQKISNMGSHILINFEDYMSKIDLTAAALDEPHIDIMSRQGL